MSISGNDPVYPQPERTDYVVEMDPQRPSPMPIRRSAQPGLTLRQHFAGQALICMGTWMPDYHPSGAPIEAVKSLCNPEMMRARAEWACAQADALIAALNEKEPS